MCPAIGRCLSSYIKILLYSGETLEGENFHEFCMCLEHYPRKFLHKILGILHAPTDTIGLAFCKSFLHKMITSYWSTKVFFLKSFSYTISPMITMQPLWLPSIMIVPMHMHMHVSLIILLPVSEPILFGSCNVSDFDISCNTSLDQTRVPLEYTCSYDFGPEEPCMHLIECITKIWTLFAKHLLTFEHTVDLQWWSTW